MNDFKIFVRSFLVFLVALSLSSGPVFAQDVMAASAASQQVIDVVGVPEEGKALVVFFRKKAFKGGGVRFKVREDEVEYGKLSSGTWFAIQATPGEHTYVVHSEAKDVTRLELEAGQTYFVAGTVTMGFLAGRPNLAPSDAAAFEALLPKLKPAKPLK